MEQWKRTVAVWIMTAILFCGIPRPLTAWGQETPGELHAGFAVLIDGDTGRVLYGKNEKEIRPMASTTKIMTCILALELGNLDDEVTFSSKHNGIRPWQDDGLLRVAVLGKNGIFENYQNPEL